MQTMILADGTGFQLSVSEVTASPVLQQLAETAGERPGLPFTQATMTAWRRANAGVDCSLEDACSAAEVSAASGLDQTAQ